MKNRDRNIREYDNLENWHVKTCTFLLSYLELHGTISARNCIRWILIRDDVRITGSACNILNLPIFRPENAKHSGKSLFKSNPGIQTRTIWSERSVYTRPSLRIWNHFYARVICTTRYIFIELQIGRTAGWLSGIFGKSGKNYRLWMAPRIVQTPAGNLDKWRSNDSRPVDLLPSMIARPPLFAVIKKFRDQTIERGAIDMHFTTNWFFYSKRYFAPLMVNSISDT